MYELSSYVDEAAILFPWHPYLITPLLTMNSAVNTAVTCHRTENMCDQALDEKKGIPVHLR